MSNHVKSVIVIVEVKRRGERANSNSNLRYILKGLLVIVKKCILTGWVSNQFNDSYLYKEIPESMLFLLETILQWRDSAIRKEKMMKILVIRYNYWWKTGYHIRWLFMIKLSYYYPHFIISLCKIKVYLFCICDPKIFALSGTYPFFLFSKTITSCSIRILTILCFNDPHLWLFFIKKFKQ